MLTLRPYQEESIQAVFDYWSEEPGSPLIDLATGLGKSLVAADMIKRLVEGWPDMRIVVATHVAELIEQNFKELVGMWPFAPAGIYSAGLVDVIAALKCFSLVFKQCGIKPRKLAMWICLWLMRRTLSPPNQKRCMASLSARCAKPTQT